MQRLVVWGTGGHALVVSDIVRAEGRYELAGFIDDAPRQRLGSMFAGAPVLGGRDRLPLLRAEGIAHAIVAVGDCARRLQLAEIVLAQGLTLATAIHPRATLAADVAVGPGTVVAAGAVVNPGASIGCNVIINTLASVDHECRIEDGVHVGPGARLGGNVSVGRGTWIGIGATVIDSIVIGAGSIVGAGAVVVRDIPAGVVVYGVPATVRRPV